MVDVEDVGDDEMVDVGEGVCVIDKVVVGVGVELRVSVDDEEGVGVGEDVEVVDEVDVGEDVEEELEEEDNDPTMLNVDKGDLERVNMLVFVGAYV